jgi:hypothetical protein
MTLQGLVTARGVRSRQEVGGSPRARFSTRQSSRSGQRRDVGIILQEALELCRSFDTFDDHSKDDKKDQS